MIEPGPGRDVSWPAVGFSNEWLEIGYLADLAHVSNEQVARAVQGWTALHWSNLLQVNAEISEVLARQQAAMRELTRALVSAGALEPSELRMTFRIEVKIEDQRSDRSVALPPYAPVEFRVR